MVLVIVHLTDIHIRDEDDLDILSARIPSLGAAIVHHITEPDDTSVIICMTGDFAFSGQENQYVAIELLLEELFNIIKKNFPRVGIHPVFVPGNHDCNFDDESASVREAILDSPTLDMKMRHN